MQKYLNTKFDFNSADLIEVFDEVPLWSAPFGRKLLEVIRFRRGMSALDIGFGTGFPLTELAMRLGDSCHVYGIDPWEAASARAMKKMEVFGINNVEILNGTAEAIPLDDDSIDLVTSNNGINNIPNQQLVLRECSRVIRSGGQLVQTLNLDNTMMEFYDVVIEVLMDTENEEVVEKVKNHIYEKRKPLEEVIVMMEINGFSILNVEHDQFDYRFMDGTTLLNHYHIGLGFLGAWKSMLPEEMRSEVFKRVETRMNQMAERDGHFRLSVPFVCIDAIKTT